MYIYRLHIISTYSIQELLLLACFRFGALRALLRRLRCCAGWVWVAPQACVVNNPSRVDLPRPSTSTSARKSQAFNRTPRYSTRQATSLELRPALASGLILELGSNRR